MQPRKQFLNRQRHFSPNKVRGKVEFEWCAIGKVARCFAAVGEKDRRAAGKHSINFHLAGPSFWLFFFVFHFTGNKQKQMKTYDSEVSLNAAADLLWFTICYMGLRLHSVYATAITK